MASRKSIWHFYKARVIKRHKARVRVLAQMQEEPRSQSFCMRLFVRRQIYTGLEKFEVSQPLGRLAIELVCGPSGYGVNRLYKGAQV